MQTYYNILDTIRRQLLQDKFVNTVTNGDIFDVDLEKKTIYPLSHVMVNQATRKDKVYTLNMTVLLMDIVDKVNHEAQDVFKGNDNEQDVFNTQLAVGARLVEVLKRGDLRDNNFELSSDPNFEPFTERFENSLAGWALTFDVDMPNDMTICDADIVPSDCAAANYSITDEDGNVLYSGTIESGLSLTQAITNSDVQNSDGSYSVGVPAQGNLTLPDETIRVKNTIDTTLATEVKPSVKDSEIEIPNVDNIDSDGSTVSTPAGVPFMCSGVPSLPSGTYTPTVAGTGGFELPWTGKTANVSTLDGEIQHTGSGTLNGSAYCEVGVNGDFDLSFQLVGNNVGFGISYFKDLAQNVNQYYGIDFFVLKQAGRYYVFGNGFNHYNETGFVDTDTVRIARVGSEIRYYKNDVLKYTQAIYNTSFINLNSCSSSSTSIENITITV